MHLVDGAGGSHDVHAGRVVVEFCPARARAAAAIGAGESPDAAVGVQLIERGACRDSPRGERGIVVHLDPARAGTTAARYAAVPPDAAVRLKLVQAPGAGGDRRS